MFIFDYILNVLTEQIIFLGNLESDVHTDQPCSVCLPAFRLFTLRIWGIYRLVQQLHQVCLRFSSGSLKVFLRFASGSLQVIIWLSSGSPQVLFRFSSGSLQVLLRFSGSPQVLIRLSGSHQFLLWFFSGYPLVLPQFSSNSSQFLLRFSSGYSVVFLKFSSFSFPSFPEYHQIWTHAIIIVLI